MSEAAVRVLPDDEAAAFVLRELERGPRTTREIDEAARAMGVSCPDGTPRFLARLQRRGLVEGRLDVPRRTWLWWRAGAPGP